MKLTILGSGSLFPYPNRGNSAYLLECSEATILLDGGSGTLRRIADFGLDYSSIDIICYTHLHIDHTFDLIPFLFALKHDSKVKKPKVLLTWAPHIKPLPHAVPNSFVRAMKKMNFDISIANPKGFDLDPTISKGLKINNDKKTNSFYLQNENYKKNQSELRIFLKEILNLIKSN